MYHITQIVRREGLVGLQKLEAQSLIKGDFSRRKGKIQNRGDDADTALAIAKGIGRHDNLDSIMEMIEWLREGDYLIDYGYITVSLAVSAGWCKSLEESKYIAILEHFRAKMDDEDEIFNIEFLLDYRKLFCEKVVEWLLDMKERQSFSDDTIIIKTSCGYSYCYKDDFPDVPEGEMIYMDRNAESGMHYNRYFGYVCTD